MHIDLRPTDARVAAGLNVGTVSIPSHNRPNERPRTETVRLICETIESSAEPVTRTEIARALGRAKTPYLIDVIESLVGAGVLSRSHYVRHNGVVCYLYELREW